VSPSAHPLKHWAKAVQSVLAKQASYLSTHNPSAVFREQSMQAVQSAEFVSQTVLPDEPDEVLPDELDEALPTGPPHSSPPSPPAPSPPGLVVPVAQA
jgi:uncharacterized membrane protein YccC